MNAFGNYSGFLTALPPPAAGGEAVGGVRLNSYRVC